MSLTHRFSVSVAGAVIDDQGRFLCIKRRDNGNWEPPGGLVEPGETLLEAVIREVAEETGYVVVPDGVCGVYQNMKRDIVSVVFRCTVKGGQAQSTAEAEVVQWWNAASVQSLMDEAYAVRLLDALEPHRVSARAHDGFQLF
jgi:8-oxo-dGTP diphosphatase